MELRHIRYFLAVAEESNFTRAAERLGISQPPLSQQIKDLEGEIGTALFHRVPHGAELTEAGRAFLEAVQLIPVQTDRAVGAAQAAARGQIGAVRVGFTASAAFNPVVASAIRSFRRAYSQVQLMLDEGSSPSLLAKLRQGELDAVFVRSLPADLDDVTSRMVFEEPMIAALPAGHSAAAAPKVDLIQLRSDTFILIPREISPTLFDAVISACRNAGFEPVFGQFAPQMISVVGLVAVELGIAIVPASLRHLRVPGVIYRELEKHAPIARLELVHRRGEMSKVVRNFVGQRMS